MSTTAILGLGLMGGSLVRDLSSQGRAVRAWSPVEVEVSAASELPGVTGVPDAARAVQGAEMVVLAAPLAAISGLLTVVTGLGPGVAVQDLASLQAPPLAWAREAGISGYVSAHPLAGAEASGWPASRTGLYEGRPVFLSSAGAPPEIRTRVERFWSEVGGVPEWTDAREHDRRMARVSHLPQVVATHLAATLAEAGVDAAQLGPGGRDTTRLAGSNPEIWGDILTHSGAELAPALRGLARRLAAEADALEAGDSGPFAGTLEETRRWRAGEGGS